MPIAVQSVEEQGIEEETLQEITKMELDTKGEESPGATTLEIVEKQGNQSLWRRLVRAGRALCGWFTNPAASLAPSIAENVVDIISAFGSLIRTKGEADAKRTQADADRIRAQGEAKAQIAKAEGEADNKRIRAAAELIGQGGSDVGIRRAPNGELQIIARKQPPQVS
jgi:hypothetical protein